MDSTWIIVHDLAFCPTSRNITKSFDKLESAIVHFTWCFVYFVSNDFQIKYVNQEKTKQKQNHNFNIFDMDMQS